jgi:hypothetical protein
LPDTFRLLESRSAVGELVPRIADMEPVKMRAAFAF